MQQVYHSNAMTNINIRHQIQTSSSSNEDISLRFGVSSQTVYKCRACLPGRRTGYELKPDIFKLKPRDFENDLLNLRYKFYINNVVKLDNY